MIRVLTSKWAKGVVFVLGLVPFMWLVSRVVVRDLTANPIEYMTHFTGDWGLRFLLITLGITPLRMLFKKPALTRFRRMLGLYAFFYACLHLSIWLLLDQQLDVGAMVEDVIKRKYITVGMAAYLAMVPLAITSTSGWVRRLGYRRWQKLHRLVYASATAAVIHYYWLVKSDVREPLMYAAILAVLLAVRVPTWLRGPQPAAKRRRAPATSS
jgi:sulfoxide reductase heme-binding subunit YedZ